MTVRRDVSQTRKAEEALRESEGRFRQVLEASPDLICKVSLPSGACEYVSPAVLSLTGFTTEEFAALGIRDYRRRIHPADWPEHTRRFAAFLELGSPDSGAQRIEYRWKCKDGQYRWFSDSLALVRCEDGQPVALVINARDTTERRHAEQALRESEERFRTLYESSRDGIAAADLDGRITGCNRAYADMLGYSREELQRIRYQDMTPSKWHAVNADVVRQVMERGYSEEFEKEYIKKDGTVFPVALSVWRVEDEAGRPVGVWSIVRDVTERKRADEALRASGERFRSLAASVPVGIFRTDAEGKIEYVNQRVLKITGLTALEETADWRWGIDPHPDDREAVLAERTKAMAEARVFLGDFRILTPQGVTRWVETRNSPLFNEKGEQIGRAGMVEDVTERRQAEAALRDSEERFRSLSAAAPIGIMLIDNRDGVFNCNKRFLSIFRLPQEKAMGFGWVKSLHPDNREAFFAERSKAMAEGREFVREFRAVISGRDALVESTYHAALVPGWSIEYSRGHPGGHH